MPLAEQRSIEGDESVGGGRPKELIRTINYVRDLRAETYKETPDNATSEMKACNEMPINFPVQSFSLLYISADSHFARA